MDNWGFEQLEPWLRARETMPVGPLFCVINGPSCGHAWHASAARMFAAFEAILTVGIAVGALLTPLVIDILGIRLALVAVGLVTPLAVARLLC